MKFRTRLTLQFSVVVSVILITFSLIIYMLLSEFRRDEFAERLRDKGLNSVKLLADVDEVSPDLLKIIDRNAVNPLPQEQIFIYDTDYKLVYCSLPIDTDAISRTTLQKVHSSGEILFAIDSTEFVAFNFTGKYDRYLVVASANDQFGWSKLNYLRNTLISGDILATGLIFLIGLFFSREALLPLYKVLGDIDKITASNLGLRIDVGKKKDELSVLALKFNQMLERLDESFEAQRSFVSNASHELRTPLTSLTGQIEVTLMNPELNEIGRDALTSLQHEIRQLNKLSNGLLDLAHANLDITELRLTHVRIDELLGQARAELLKRNKEFRVNLEFSDFPEEENWLTIPASEQLLKSAIINVLENACKYSSDHSANLLLRIDPQYVNITVTDNGIGMTEEELAHIYEPFYRAAGVRKMPGHGIGLTLTKKILELHRGTVKISSSVGAGTTVQLTLPHLS